jgi:hypothetical protein
MNKISGGNGFFLLFPGMGDALEVAIFSSRSVLSRITKS